MVLEIADKDIVFFLGLLIIWLGGKAIISVGSVPVFGYTLEKGYEYICSECGTAVPKNHYHRKEECQYKGKPLRPDHRLYYGSKKYWREPEWKIMV